MSVIATFVEFVAVTDSVLDCPALIDVGFALIVTVGVAATGVTVTVTWAVADPLPVTVMV